MKTKVYRRKYKKITSLQDYLKGICEETIGYRLPDVTIRDIEKSYNQMSKIRKNLNLVVGDHKAVEKIISVLFTVREVD